MASLTAFLAALCVAWFIGLRIGARFSGRGGASVPKWVPAAWIAQGWVCGLHPLASTSFLILGMGLALVGAFVGGVVSFLFFSAALFVLAPLAVCVCSRVREDMRRGSGEYVFYNAVRAPGTQGERKHLALYIEDDEWASIPAVTPTYLKYWQQYHVTDGLYICPCDNDVLQAVDSLNLYPFIVSPDHAKMLNAFAKALGTVRPERVSATPYAQRTLIQLQTDARNALLTSEQAV